MLLLVKVPALPMMLNKWIPFNTTYFKTIKIVFKSKINRGMQTVMEPRRLTVD